MLEDGLKPEIPVEQSLDKSTPISEVPELRDISDALSAEFRKKLSFTPKELESILKTLSTQRYFGEHASLPMKCLGADCPVSETCPLHAIGKAPVGEKCHPAGEKVLTSQHGYVPIESLDPQVHTLTTYERRRGAIRGGRNRIGSLFTISKKQYSGQLVTMKTSTGKIIRMTHDHVAIARFNEESVGKFCVYLMRRGNFWRIGKSFISRRLKGGKLYCGFKMRLNMEDADSLWILGIYNTNTEAFLAEESFSLRLQTSKVCFADSAKKMKHKTHGVYKWATLEQLEKHHQSLIKDEEFYRSALEELGLSIDYPICIRKGFSDDVPENGPYLSEVMFIRACNILPGIMDVPTIPDKESIKKIGNKQYSKVQWESICTERTPFTGTVYGLDVKHHNTYFVGGIATHNCPIEIGMMSAWLEEYRASLDISWSDKIERQAVMDLVECDILQARANGILASEGFIMDNPVGVSESTGEAIMRKEVHIAMTVKDILHKRKERLLKSLVATREVRKKLGVGSSDPAKREAELLLRIKKSEEREEQEKRDRITHKKD